MTETELYINSHKEIQKCVLIAGYGYCYSELVRFIEITRVKELVIINRNNSWLPEKYMEKLANESFEGVTISECSLKEFKGMDGDWALCAEKADPEDIALLKSLTPSWVLISILSSYRTSFSLWEMFRKCAKQITIKTVDNMIDNQYGQEIIVTGCRVLEWEKTDNDIELSVILPMYNVAKYLDDCIKGLCAWKADYVEFLFVNDGSPDNSRDIILEYAKKDSRIKLLDKKNGGCASARQYGLEKANGRYIGFVDPDDFVDESMFRKLLKAAMIGSYEISYCGYREYYENTGKYGDVEEAIDAPYCYGTSNKNDILDLINYSRVAIWRRIVKKELIESAKIHFYTDLKRFDDLPFHVETLAAAQSIVAVQEPMYFYRLARPGQDVSADDERLYVHFDIFDHLRESIESKKSRLLTDILQVLKIQTHVYALTKIRDEFKLEYMKRAKADLDATMDHARTIKIAKNRIGDHRAEIYKALVNLDVKRFDSLIASEGVK